MRGYALHAGWLVAVFCGVPAAAAHRARWVGAGRLGGLVVCYRILGAGWLTIGAGLNPATAAHRARPIRGWQR